MAGIACEQVILQAYKMQVFPMDDGLAMVGIACGQVILPVCRLQVFPMGDDPAMVEIACGLEKTPWIPLVSWPESAPSDDGPERVGIAFERVMLPLIPMAF